MPFVPRLTSLKRDVLQLASTFRRRSRRLARPTGKGGVALFLAAFSLFSPVPPVDASAADPLNSADFPIDASAADPLNSADSPVDASAANPPFPLFSHFQRPALLCELAGLPSATLNWENNANGAPCNADDVSAYSPHFLQSTDVAASTETAFSSHFPLSPRVAQSLPTASPFSPLPTSADAPIVRGAYISNLPIAPFRGRIFLYADGSWGRQDEQNDSPFSSGFDVASVGGGVGQDWRLSQNAIWGVGLQGRNVQINPAATIYDAEINSLAGFLRLSLFGPLWRLDMSIGAAKNWNEQSAPAGDATKYSATQWNYEAEFGVRFDKGYTRVEPLINVRVITLQEPLDAERRLAALGRPSDYSDASYRLKLGSRFSWEYATRLATLKPYLSATWAHEFGDRALYVVGENTPFPLVYRYAKHRMARDRLDLGGGVDAALRDTVDLFFRYDVEFAKEYANYLFYAGVHKKF